MIDAEKTSTSIFTMEGLEDTESEVAIHGIERLKARSLFPQSEECALKKEE
jgi:hypothetical protein